MLKVTYQGGRAAPGLKSGVHDYLDRPHRHAWHKMRHAVTDVAWSLCLGLSVCCMVTNISYVEQTTIETPFGGVDSQGARNRVLGGPDPSGKGAYLGPYFQYYYLPSVLWRCWLGGRKGIQPVKNWVVGCWRSYLSGARCRLVVQLMPLPLTVSCFSKIQICFTFLVPAHPSCPGKEAVKRV